MDRHLASAVGIHADSLDAAAETAGGGKVMCIHKCVDGPCPDEVLTNADRIRAMSYKELAKLFTHTVADGCPPDMDWECTKDCDGWDGCDACWERWLQQPAEEDYQ